jgi:uncharacterized Ntn-hydrolase superfamily protein
MSPRPLLSLAALAALALAAFARPAHATFSVLAWERSTGQFGFATASCVHLDTLLRVYASEPSAGAVAAQSYLLDGDLGRIEATTKLSKGWTAEQTLARLLAPDFDPAAHKRQYLIIDAAGNGAAHTGTAANAYAAHAGRAEGDYVVAAAGNFLTGPAVLDQALAGFYQSEACDFAARLQQALARAAQDQQGDARCVAQGRPAQSAWFVLPDLDLRVEAQDFPATDDPLVELGARFASWRGSHPCPVPPPTQPPAASSDPSGGSCALGRASGSGSAWLIAALALLYLLREARLTSPRS